VKFPWTDEAFQLETIRVNLSGFHVFAAADTCGLVASLHALWHAIGDFAGTPVYNSTAHITEKHSRTEKTYLPSHTWLFLCVMPHDLLNFLESSRKLQ